MIAYSGFCIYRNSVSWQWDAFPTLELEDDGFGLRTVLFSLYTVCCFLCFLLLQTCITLISFLWIMIVFFLTKSNVWVRNKLAIVEWAPIPYFMLMLDLSDMSKDFCSFIGCSAITFWACVCILHESIVEVCCCVVCLEYIDDLVSDESILDGASLKCSRFPCSW